MTIIHNKNIISFTIEEYHEIGRKIHTYHGDQPETIINIEIDSKGNGIISSPPIEDLNYEKIEMSGGTFYSGENWGMFMPNDIARSHDGTPKIPKTTPPDSKL